MLDASDGTTAVLVAAPEPGQAPGAAAKRASSRCARQPWAHAELGSPTRPATPVDVRELFFLLVRLKRSLRAHIDSRLRAEQGHSLEAFETMAIVSELGEGADEPALAAALSITPGDVRKLVDALASSGHLTRPTRSDDSGRVLVRMTLPGSLQLSRANQTVERELNRRLGSVLSPGELAQLEDVLATMLRRAVPAPPARGE